MKTDGYFFQRGSSSAAISSRQPRGRVGLTALSLMTITGVPAMQSVQAQETTAEAPIVSEVVVTGTRIVRDGYDAPTPVTVVGTEQIAQQASPKVIDYLTTLPAFSGNATPASATQTISSGESGTSSVNLRDLGTNRTLVLIDGQRAVGSTITGRVDINSIPSQLIERVEVVTGGASAAYGSDAVSGVVNFILDKDFSGFKAEASGGMTEHSDNRNYNVAATFGTPFAEGRGHFTVSAQTSYQGGILHADARDWVRDGAQVIYNPDYTPTNGQPEIMLARHVSPAVMAPGGLIVSGPMKGVAFGAGGTPFPLQYGQVSGDAMSGGDYMYTSLHGATSLEPKLSISNVFGRLSYDVTDNLNVFVQSNWSSNKNFGYSFPYDVFYGGLEVPVDNPYMPASIAARAQALGLQTVELGTSFQDMGSIIQDNKRDVVRNVIGFNTKFDAFNTTWAWDGYYQYGTAETSEYARNSANMDRLDLALNAVLDPNTGGIVCASTLTDPGNGCVPLNPFGTGVNSDTVLRYILGTPAHRSQRFKQTVVATSVQGNPFSSWAGPVSLAGGVEYREESASGSSTALDKQRVFWGGNYLPTFGRYHVTEGFLETVVPLASDQPWAKSLDLNAAARFTDYSTSGYVTTWKLGLTYSPIDDVRVRVTQSRDIRAPNLADLYNGGTTAIESAIDPSTKQAVAYRRIVGGNPNLDPEIADSFGVGLVLQPSFAPGLSASVDYWSIDIKDAITTYNAQQMVDFCYQGNQSICAAINDGAPLHPAVGSDSDINLIRIQPFNLASQVARGIDVELGYRLPMTLLDGNVALRMLATHYLKNELDRGGGSAPNDIVGQNGGNDAGPPDWRWNASVTYNRQEFRATLGARGVSSGVFDHDYIECTSGCPASTPLHATIANNRIAGATYFDLSLSYTMLAGQAGEVETFFNVKNLTGKDPAVAPGGPNGLNFNSIPTEGSVYDTHGRVYLLGVRLKM